MCEIRLTYLLHFSRCCLNRLEYFNCLNKLLQVISSPSFKVSIYCLYFQLMYIEHHSYWVSLGFFHSLFGELFNQVQNVFVNPVGKLFVAFWREMQVVRLEQTGRGVIRERWVLVGYESTGRSGVILEISVDVVPQCFCRLNVAQVSRFRDSNGQQFRDPVIFAKLEQSLEVGNNFLEKKKELVKFDILYDLLNLFASGEGHDGNSSSRTITEVEHHEVNQLLIG